MKRKRTEKITTNEFAKIRSFLTEQGLQESNITAALGATRRNRNRAQVANDLITWLRSRPKRSTKSVSKGK